LYGRFIEPGDLVFNLGAHEGVRTAIFLKLGAQVVAVEPQPRLCGSLRERFARESVMVECAAAGPECGEVEFYLCTDDQLATCSAERIEILERRQWAPGEEWGEKARVPQTTLDQLIEIHGLPQFIKIDVEGYEDRVLEGLHEPVAGLCFEFMVGDLGPAIRSVELVADLGLRRFSYIVGEGPELQAAFMGPEAMIEELRGLPAVDFLYGDVFAVREGR